MEIVNTKSRTAWWPIRSRSAFRAQKLIGSILTVLRRVNNGRCGGHAVHGTDELENG